MICLKLIFKDSTLFDKMDEAINLGSYGDPKYIEKALKFGYKLNYFAENLSKMYKSNLYISLKWSQYCKEIINRYPFDKLDIFLNENNRKEKYILFLLAKRGYKLDLMMKENDDNIREEIVRHDYKLDEFLNDESFWVQSALIERGYALDKFIYSENPIIQESLLEQGYRLDILKNSKIKEIRDKCDKILKGGYPDGY